MHYLEWRNWSFLLITVNVCLVCPPPTVLQNKPCKKMEHISKAQSIGVGIIPIHVLLMTLINDCAEDELEALVTPVESNAKESKTRINSN